MLPLDVIIGFEARNISVFEFDWESVLECGYRQFLNAKCCVLDVGGHNGRHCAIFAEEIGCRRIVVFEPLADRCLALKQRFQGCRRVRVLSQALADRNGIAEFVINLAAPEESGLRERLYNNPEAKQLKRVPVRICRLDDLSLGLPRIDYIKIDAEGAEVDIIKGARNTLARYRPILSVEYGLSSYAAYGHTRTTLFDLLAELGYQLCDLFGNPFDAEQWDNVVDRFYWDYYAVPNEQVADFNARLWDVVYRRLDDCRVNRAGALAAAPSEGLST